MPVGVKGVKFTLQDHRGTRSVGALEVLASVIQGLIEADGRERAAYILEGIAANIRADEIGGHVEPDWPAVH